MDVLAMLEKALLAEEAEKWQRKSHYASDANACRRQLYYSWTMAQESNPVPVHSLIKMRMGNAAEGILRAALLYFKEKGEIAEIEEQVRKEVVVEGLEHPIVCKMDFIVVAPDGYREGIELKSSFGRGIVEIQKSGKPKDDHLVQCFFYLEHVVERLKLVYIGRDSGYRTEFAITRGDEPGSVYLGGTRLPPEVYNMDRFIAKFREIEAAVSAKEMLPRDFLASIRDGEIVDRFQRQGVVYVGDWQCRYCRWADLCWAEEKKTYAQGVNLEMFAKDRIATEEG
jgi:CRISPR/Cas system-associated exonuclease Cas4 (RecB family)